MMLLVVNSDEGSGGVGSVLWVVVWLAGGVGCVDIAFGLCSAVMEKPATCLRGQVAGLAKHTWCPLW